MQRRAAATVYGDIGALVDALLKRIEQLAVTIFNRRIATSIAAYIPMLFDSKGIDYCTGIIILKATVSNTSDISILSNEFLAEVQQMIRAKLHLKATDRAP
jgi:hypothetical protein